jgi:hypothetical protein
MKITVTYRINPNISKEKYVIAVFDNANDLLCCIDFMKENRFFVEILSLYKYNKKYIILFPCHFSNNKEFFSLKEFGKIKFVCKNLVAHIKEYGTFICDNLIELLK